MPIFEAVDVNVVATPTIAVVGEMGPAVRSGKGAAVETSLTVSVRVGDVAEPPGPVHVTVWVYVPGVFMGPVDWLVAEVTPRSPFQIPDPLQLVAPPPDEKEIVELWPVEMVAGENGVSETVVGVTVVPATVSEQNAVVPEFAPRHIHV